MHDLRVRVRGYKGGGLCGKGVKGGEGVYLAKQGKEGGHGK